MLSLRGISILVFAVWLLAPASTFTLVGPHSARKSTSLNLEDWVADFIGRWALFSIMFALLNRTSMSVVVAPAFYSFSSASFYCCMRHIGFRLCLEGSFPKRRLKWLIHSWRQTSSISLASCLSNSTDEELYRERNKKGKLSKHRLYSGGIPTTSCILVIDEHLTQRIHEST